MRTAALAFCVALALVAPELSRADHLVVSRTTAIRAGPSRNSDRMSTARSGDSLPLLRSDLENGYYRITDPTSGRTGWIYKTFVRRFTDEDDTTPSPDPGSNTSPESIRAIDCSAKKPLRVHFYDVGQALSALVDLPDGRHIVVDAGESPTRAGCGTVCRTKHEHLLDSLRSDLNGAPISMLWITHQHSDHLGGATGILDSFRVALYVDNGQDLGATQVKKARDLATAHRAEVVAVDPEHSRSPIQGSGTALRIRPVLPSTWSVDCEAEPNSCSIGLRIDYCSSSVLFTGDADEAEEGDLEPYGNVTLLQVGHHGSDTSSTPEFLRRISPKYAVISSGAKGEGLNSKYCHPREVTVQAISAVLGSPGSRHVSAFDGAVKCSKTAPASHWHDVPTNDHLWVTPRDGDVTVTTTGDGVFEKE